MSETRGKRKVRMGRVMSDAREKTITVAVDRTFRHSLYNRVVRSKKKPMFMMRTMMQNSEISSK